tara:strand:- start:425742 stop:426284 length:543 start_codon:yes stop_codon:yes gene_type:complete
MKKNNVEIQLSKFKMALLALGAFLFVALCVFIIFNAEQMESRKSTNLLLIRIIAVIGLLFFGAIFISVLKKITSRKPGLIIDEKGIWDHSNGVSIGLIEWHHITNIRKEKIQLTQFLLLDVSNPEFYLKKAQNKMKAQLMKANMAKYGTPISISAGALKINFMDLETLINKYYLKSKLIK